MAAAAGHVAADDIDVCKAGRLMAEERVTRAIRLLCENEMERVQPGSVAARRVAWRAALALVNDRGSGLTFKKLYALAANIAAPINAKRIRMEMDESQDARGACGMAAGRCVWGGVEHGAPG